MPAASSKAAILCGEIFKLSEQTARLLTAPTMDFEPVFGAEIDADAVKS